MIIFSQEEHTTERQERGDDDIENNNSGGRPSISVQDGTNPSLMNVYASTPSVVSINNSSARSLTREAERVPTLSQQDKQESLYSTIMISNQDEKQEEKTQINDSTQNQVPNQASSENVSQDLPDGGGDGEARRVLDRYLATISLRMQQEWRLDESGMWAFTYDSLKFVIEVPLSGTNYFIYTSFTGMNKNEVSISTVKQMLRLNYLSKQTRGGCLSFEKDGGDDELIFSYSGHYPEISGDAEFQLILENFMDVALKLYAHLKTDTNQNNNRCCYRFKLPRYRKKLESGDEFPEILPAMNERVSTLLNENVQYLYEHK